jgi:hypothetical protein
MGMHNASLCFSNAKQCVVSLSWMFLIVTLAHLFPESADTDALWPIVKTRQIAFFDFFNGRMVHC